MRSNTKKFVLGKLKHDYLDRLISDIEIDDE
ncbi:hypothetical protein LCGC14_2161340, partial [marine sediment metagenome]